MTKTLTEEELKTLIHLTSLRINTLQHQLHMHIQDDKVNGTSSYNWDLWSKTRTEYATQITYFKDIYAKLAYQLYDLEQGNTPLYIKLMKGII